jgi:hypothetical protein
MSSSQEFIDFMIGGSKKNNKDISPSRNEDTPQRIPTVGTPSITSPSMFLRTPTSGKEGQQLQLVSSSSYTLLQKAFVQSMMEWIDMDDQLYNIIQSVINLRERIWSTSQLLEKSSSFIDAPGTGTSTVSSSWKQYGYRNYGHSSVSPNFLNANDLQCTIDHNLQHHERMIREIRSILSLMNVLQEKMSRRYDELYQTSCMDIPMYERRGGNIASFLSLNDCETLLLSMARELYRKQILALQIINSSTVDGLLSTEDIATFTTQTVRIDRTVEDATLHPRDLAQKCSLLWPWTSRESYLWLHRNRIQEILAHYK